MEKLANPGDFCPNDECQSYGKLQKDQLRPNIVKYGKSKSGAQRYKCKICGKVFTETKGTIFYRKQTDKEDILKTIAQIAEGLRISSASRVMGHTEDTISQWLKEASHHAETVEQILLCDYKLEQAQIDGLWSYVKNKGSKKL